jgi:hypothetical protein
MPRILGTPVTFDKFESAMKSNLKFGEIAGLEELLGDYALFEEYGVADVTYVVMECNYCEDKTTLTTGTRSMGMGGTRAKIIPARVPSSLMGARLLKREKMSCLSLSELV